MYKEIKTQYINNHDEIRTFTMIASSFQTTGPYGHGTIVHFWVRFDRWINEVKTYLLQP